jgi:AcrR family transcriptional regulator
MLHGTDRFRSLDSKKRSVVLDAAADEFATFGYLAASTNRIAASAKISKGALFSYFPTKEMLFAGVLGALFDQVQAESPELVAAPAHESLDADLRALAARLFALHQRWRRLFRLGHELTFQSAHINDAASHAARYAALVDAHVRSAVAASSAKLTVDREIAEQIALAAFDRLRARLITTPLDALDEAQFNAAATAVASAVARAVGPR